MDYSKVFETMIQDTQKYLEDHNLFAMILGISGGIDSTVTAAICHEVEKRNPDIKFIGISLPCTSNSSNENNSANCCMKAFCKKEQYWTENLQKEYMLMRATCSQRHSMTTIGAGNIKARLRMMVLYNEANYFFGLVMDTDNLTEHYLGFFTIHGDVADFNPIGGLWKHEVYELANYIANKYKEEAENLANKVNDKNLSNSDVKTLIDERIKVLNKYLALKQALDITPTDGNGVKAGGDMAQIAPAFINDINVEAYKKVDDIIQTYIEYRGHRPEEYQIAMEELYNKYDKETVDGVINRINKTEYKRKRLPLVIERNKYDN